MTTKLTDLDSARFGFRSRRINESIKCFHESNEYENEFNIPIESWKDDEKVFKELGAEMNSFESERCKWRLGFITLIYIGI